MDFRIADSSLDRAVDLDDLREVGDWLRASRPIQAGI